MRPNPYLDPNYDSESDGGSASPKGNNNTYVGNSKRGEEDEEKFKTNRNFHQKRLLPDTLYQLALCSCMQYGQNVLLIRETIVTLPTLVGSGSGTGRSTPSPPSSRNERIKSANSFNNLLQRHPSPITVFYSEKTNHTAFDTAGSLTPEKITPRDRTPRDRTPREINIGTSPRNQIIINKNPKIINHRSLSPTISSSEEQKKNEINEIADFRLNRNNNSNSDYNSYSESKDDKIDDKKDKEKDKEVDLLAVRRSIGSSKDNFAASNVTAKRTEEAMDDLFQRTVYLLDQARIR